MGWGMGRADFCARAVTGRIRRAGAVKRQRAPRVIGVVSELPNVKLLIAMGPRGASPRKLAQTRAFSPSTDLASMWP